MKGYRLVVLTLDVLAFFAVGGHVDWRGALLLFGVGALSQFMDMEDLGIIERQQQKKVKRP